MFHRFKLFGFNFLLALLAFILMPFDVSAATNDNYAYRDRCPAQGDQFVDSSGFYGCECTSYVAQHLRDNGLSDFSNTWRGAGFHNATTWLQGAATLGIPYSSNARIGDVAYWKGNSSKRYTGSAGHVAEVVSVNSNGTVNVREYNYARKFDFGYATGVTADHYIHFPITNQQAAPPSVALIQPTDATNYPAATTQVALSWNASADASNFRVIVSRRADFGGFNDNGGGSSCDSTCATWATTDRTTTFTTARPNETYYWKVRANSAANSLASPFTASRSFTIAANSSETNGSPGGVAQRIDQCIKRFETYFGNKRSGIYSCGGDYVCQETSGVVAAIAIDKNLNEPDFYYYYTGKWSSLNLNYCN